MVIDENAAFQVLNSLPTLDDARKERAARMLRDYEGQQDRLGLPLWPSRVAELERRREKTRSVFDNPLVLDADDGTYQAADAVEQGTGERMRKREANILFLADKYQADETDVRQRFDFYKADMGAKWGTGTLDDEAFFSKAKGEVDKDRATETRRLTVAQQAAQAALTGGSFLDAMVTSGAEDDEDKRVFRESFGRVSKKLAPYRGLIQEVASEGKRMMTSGEGADWSALADRLMTVPKDQRGLVLDALGRMEGEQVEGGATKTLLHAFARGLENYIDRAGAGAAGFIREQAAGKAEFAAGVAGLVGMAGEEEGRALNRLEAEKDKADEMRELAQDARAIAAGTLSPLRNVELLGMNLTGAAENLPMTAGALVPLAGPASMVAFFKDATDEELRREFPDMDRTERQKIATLSAPIQAATEVISDRLLVGRLANLKSVFNSPAFQAVTIAKRLAGVAVVGTATETVEELAQGVTSRAVMEIQQALGADVPDVDWQGYFSKFGNDLPELLSTVIPLALIGAGVGQVSDYQQARDLVSNDTLLRAAGYENAADIKALADAGKWRQAETLMREQWVKVAPKGESVSEVAAAASETVIQAKTAEVKAATEEVRKIAAENEEARRVIEQAEARAMIPRIRKDSQGWSVVDVETGASLRVQTRDDAVAIAYEGLSELERTSSAAMAQVAEEFMGLRPGAAEVVEISKQAGTMEREVKEGRVTEQQGQEAVELYGMMHGLKLGEARAEAVEVLGNNKAEEIEGIRTAVSRIWGGGNLITVMHEGIHGRWRAGLEKGHYTQKMGVQWVRMAERASGQQFLPVTDDAAVTPAMLDEAIVEVATADLIGKRKDAKQHFTPGLISRGVASFALSQRAEAKAAGRFATWLKAWKDFWGRVLRNAKALKKARAEGKLGEDFDSFLDDLLGAEPQQRFEAQAAREAVDMAGEVDNAPFSLRSLRDAAGDANENAQSGGESQTSFSLAPRSPASVADTVLASKMKKPEFREALYRVAREKMDRLRSDGEWRVSRLGVASRRTGTDTLAAGDRTRGSIENERKFRFRSRQRELVEAGMNDLSPNQMMALERGTEKWEDRPLLARIFAGKKLMSMTTAKRLGKFRPLAGDYDMAPGWLPPSMFAKGDAGYMPDQLAKEAFGDQALPDQLWDEIRRAMDEVTKGNQEARAAQQKVKEIEAAALKQARAESDAWAKEARAQVPTPKERQMAALRTLDAILSAFPAEIRGQVGGFVKLASLGSDKAREAEIVKRLEKLDMVVEKEAKKHYLEAIEGTFEKAKPKKGKAGEKPKGKLGANVQALVDLARTFSELDEMGVSAERAAIADRLSKATDPAAIADLVEREQLLDLFGALDERTSAELEAAAEWLEDTYTKGRNRWRAVIEQRETETAAQRAAAVKEIGKQGLDSEQQDALKQAKTIKKASGGMALSWLSFEQVMSSILGRKSKLARDTVAAARVATNQKTDALRARRAAFKAAMSSIFGGVKQSQWQSKLYDLQQIGGVKVTKLEGARTETRQVAAEAVERIINGTATAKAFGLDALTLDKLSDAWADNAALPANRQKKNLAFDVPISGTPTETELSQLQAVHLSMMGRQAAYTEVLAGHGWTAEVMESIEKQLTPEAMGIRDWLSEQYRGGWEPLNAVYARMYGVNLPRIPNYAPGTFEARDMMGQDVDPYGQGLLSEGGFRAGMLKTRGKHNARPRLEDALSVYWGHVNATEHFQAFAEFARDLRGVMNNADVRASITAKGGKDLLQSGQSWIEAFERNGLAARSASSRWDEFLRRRQASQAYLALAYNMGILMKQSTAALGSLLNMGPGQAARQFSKLVTNQLDLKAAYDSDVIQRRLDAGYSPEVRQAMAAMMAEKPSWGTGFVQRGMEIIGMVDAVFTTASYAMAYDFHLSQARAAGLNEAQAKVEAEREAEATVARTAQPSEMMDRSLFEMGLQPTGKFLFMFASEARQKAALALEAYSPSSGLSKGERATRLFTLHVAFPLAIQTITNLWRDAREDDDEELFDSDNWRAGDYAKSMVLGPALGIPLIGQALNAALQPVFGGRYFANDPTQPINRAIGGVEDIKEAIQEGDLESGLKGTRSLMWAVALAMGGEKAAAVGVGSNILFDAFRVVENVTE